MARDPKTDTIEGLKVTSMPLPFAQAEPMLPEVGQFLALVFEELAKAVDGVDLKAMMGASEGGKFDIRKINLGTISGATLGKFGAAARTAAVHLGDGKLSKLAPRLLATTTVVFVDPITGEREIKDLSKAKDREVVFDECPAAYLPIVFFAGRTTYERYFSAAALTGGETPSGSS